MDLPIRNTPQPPAPAPAPAPIPQLPPQLFTTAASLLDLTDKKLLVTLRDGTHLHGILRSWDQFGNLVLTEVERWRFLSLPSSLPSTTSSDLQLQLQDGTQSQTENQPPPQRQTQQQQKEEQDPIALLKAQLRIPSTSTPSPTPSSQQPSQNQQTQAPQGIGTNGIGIEGQDLRHVYTTQPLGLYIIRGENIVLMGEIDLDLDDEPPPNSTYLPREEFERAETAVKGGLSGAEGGRDEMRTRTGAGGVGQKAREARRIRKLRSLGFEGESSGDVIY